MDFFSWGFGARKLAPFTLQLQQCSHPTPLNFDLVPQPFLTFCFSESLTSKHICLITNVRFLVIAVPGVFFMIVYCSGGQPDAVSDRSRRPDSDSRRHPDYQGVQNQARKQAKEFVNALESNSPVTSVFLHLLTASSSVHVVRSYVEVALHRRRRRFRNRPLLYSRALAPLFFRDIHVFQFPKHFRCPGSVFLAVSVYLCAIRLLYVSSCRPFEICGVPNRQRSLGNRAFTCSNAFSNWWKLQIATSVYVSP